MNNIDTYAVKDLWVDNFDSYKSKCNRLFTSWLSLGGGYPPGTGPYQVPVSLEQGCGQIVIEVNANGNDFTFQLDPQFLPNPQPPFASFVDLIIHSTELNAPYGAPITNIYIMDNALNIIGHYLHTNVNYRTAVIRVVIGNTATDWRTYLLNEY